MSETASEKASEVLQVPATDVSADSEAAPIVPKEEPQNLEPQAPQNDDFVAKFATLKKKERELFQKERELKALKDKLSKYEQLEDLKSKDPFKYIKEQGIEFDSVVSAALKQDEPPTVEDKVKALEEKIAAYEREMKEREERAKAEQEKAAIDTFRKNLESEIKSKSDDFELINAWEEYDTVFEVIRAHYDKTLEETGTGEVMPVLEAASKVEAYLLERAKKSLGAKKLAQVLGSSDVKANSEQPKPQSPTLNASVKPQASSPTQVRYEFTPEGIERKKAEAARLLRWT